MKKKKAKKTKIDFIKEIKKNKILLGVVGIIIIVVAIYLMNNNLGFGKSSNDGVAQKNLKLNTIEWRNPKTITPYGGRFYDKCEDGTNLGSVWVDIETKNQEPGLFFTCKINIIPEDIGKSIEIYQLNLISGTPKSSFIGFTVELAKEHSVEVCCKNNDKNISFCQSFELEAYC